jgi:HlyD family secretion protein
MRKEWRTRTVWAALALGVSGAIYWGLRPQPVPVDLATISRGRLEVTVDEEGVTSIRDVYVVSATVPGRMLRSPFKAGDTVEKGAAVSRIEPSAPPFLDERDRRSAEAAARSAEASVAFSEVNLTRFEAELVFSRSDLTRAERLAPERTISERQLDQARLDVKLREAAVASAKADVAFKREQLNQARARLIEPDDSAAARSARCCFDAYAPVSGRILKVRQESEAVLPAGAPLAEIGDPKNIEIVADFLSSDAVKIYPGAEAVVDGWGGPPLHAKVRLVEPSGFLKVSALGIEEQRVKVRLDLTDPAELWLRLGHDYRVFVHVIVWKADDALLIPLSALFRQGDAWAVYKAENGLAKRATINITQRNLQFAATTGGIKDSDRIITHPSDRISEGAVIIERK